ncbi:hypothetical protein GCM10029964_086520 [Kibdelosporangium lantanae]
MDRGAEQAAELEPVFIALADTEKRIRRLREGAAEDAARLRVEAEEHAVRIVDQARMDCAAVRTQVVAEVRTRMATEQAAIVADADRRIRLLVRAADSRMPDYVERVRAELDVILGELT